MPMSFKFVTSLKILSLNLNQLHSQQQPIDIISEAEANHRRAQREFLLNGAIHAAVIRYLLSLFNLTSLVS
jgi:hypothetical protein